MKLRHVITSTILAGAMSLPAFAAESWDASSIVSIIQGCATVIISVGTAAFSIYGLIFSYKTVRTMVRSG